MYIYEVQLDPPAVAKLARIPLAVLNDRIIHIGVELGLDVLELRSVGTEPDDFVLQSEPSARGAEKIARAISSAAVEGAAHSASRFFGAPTGA